LVTWLFFLGVSLLLEPRYLGCYGIWDKPYLGIRTKLAVSPFTLALSPLRGEGNPTEFRPIVGISSLRDRFIREERSVK
jgi:hypothetical protein